MPNFVTTNNEDQLVVTLDEIEEGVNVQIGEYTLLRLDNATGRIVLYEGVDVPGIETNGEGYVRVVKDV